MKRETQPKSRGTFNLLERVGPNLFRHPNNKIYYGVKKIAGKRRVESLDTTDARIAERKLADWLRDLRESDPTSSDLTMSGLFERYRRTMTSKPQTRDQNEVVMRRFTKTFVRGMDTPVRKVRPSDIAEWFAKNCQHMRHGAYNEYRRVLKRIFRLAIEDRVIAPPGFFSDKLVPKKKKQEIVRNIPTAEQFAAILAEMRRLARAQFHPDAQGADFAEFMGLAAVGQAEASSVQWEDITETEVRFGRVKTGVPFSVPLFSNLREFLGNLRARRGGTPTGRIFSIKNCAEAFMRAVETLELPHFTVRNLRSMRIVAWLDAGVDVKQVAEWQGHQDGGKLIWDTYSDVVRSNKNAYLEEQIARAEGKIVRFQAA